MYREALHRLPNGSREARSGEEVDVSSLLMRRVTSDFQFEADCLRPCWSTR